MTEPNSLAHLDDPDPPALDDGRWERIRSRSRAIARRRRVTLTTAGTAAIVAVILVAAGLVLVDRNQHGNGVVTVGASSSTTLDPSVWVTVRLEVDHTVVNQGQDVTGTVYFHNRLAVRVSLPSARPAAWQVVLGAGDTAPAVDWLDTPAAQHLDLAPGTTGVPFRASTRRPCPNSTSELSCPQLLPPGLAEVLFVTDGAVTHLAIPAPVPITISGRGGPPPQPLPCPVPSPEPSMATGQYCGPVPPPGNGLGPNGECTGRETTAPCGPGVVVGRYYAFTLPGACDGVIHFDGRVWISELPPPTKVADFAVWMRLDPSGELRFIGAKGSVGFMPDHGQPRGTCSG